MKPLEATANKNPVVVVGVPCDDSKKTIIVLGVERGGTSMVAGMVRALGVDMGERAGRNHEDPKFLTDDRDKLLAQIKAYNEKKPIWGFKVPKASLMLDFYDKHLRNPHYILVFRNIEATVDSWCNRGVNDPIQSALHAINYYNTALDFFKGKKKPLVFVSYERACDNPEGFARDLAGFIGVHSDQGLIQKAASIVTGEGGGYLDLPEFYFHIEALDSKQSPSVKLPFVYADDSENHLQRGPKKIGDRIVLEPEGEFFPKVFFIEFDIDTDDNNFLLEQGLRVYMNFTGSFFPGHAFRPPIRKGRNLLKISSNGNVRHVALGPLQPKVEYGVKGLQCFMDNGSIQEDPIISSNISPVVPSLFIRVIRKMKRMLNK